jgi:hypothetical protein
MENKAELARSYWEQSLPFFRELCGKVGLMWALHYLSELRRHTATAQRREDYWKRDFNSIVSWATLKKFHVLRSYWRNWK